MNMISESVRGVDKTTRYKWTIKDEPGRLCYVHKNNLHIDRLYQREAIVSKIKEITGNWSWVAAGVIIVGDRDGKYYVIDGQHRVLSAKRRADISELPCVIFKTTNIKQEATGFLDLNTGRKPISAIAKFNALIAAEDETAIKIDKILKGLGIIPKPTANRAKELKCLIVLYKRAQENIASIESVLKIAATLSKDYPITEIMIDSLWFIDRNSNGFLDDKRFVDRLEKIGESRLNDAAKKASAYFAKGGAKIWAMGMMEEINKGLKNKYNLNIT